MTTPADRAAELTRRRLEREARARAGDPSQSGKPRAGTGRHPAPGAPLELAILATARQALHDAKGARGEAAWAAVEVAEEAETILRGVRAERERIIREAPAWLVRGLRGNGGDDLADCPF